MDTVHYLTAEGAEKMRNELEHLKGPARQQLAHRLRAAIQQGDLSENADYSAAKEEQSFLEGKIQELEAVLKNVVIIEKKGSSEIAEIGSHVTVQEEGEAPEVFYLVGPKEADPKKGMISYESPLGAALLGHRSGEHIKAVTPGGEIHIRIIHVE
jgi:transcription elongation factor GreA